MAFVHGKNSVLHYGGVDLTTFLTDIGEDLSRDTSDTTAMGSEAKTNVAGTYGGSWSLSGWFDPTETTGPHAVLRAAFLAGTDAEVEYGPAGDTTGLVKETGQAKVTAYAATSSVEDTVAFTATLTLNGPLVPDEWA